MKLGLQILFILTMAPLVLSYCPQKKMRKYSKCALHIECHSYIRDVGLPPECKGSINEPVIIDVILTEASAEFNERFIDDDFLIYVTSLKVSGNWSESSLEILEYMPRLGTLILAGNNIRSITGKPFYHLNHLETIDLSYNNLKNIDNIFMFESRSYLKVISLAFNVIETIPKDAFNNLNSLVELDLSHNFISNITEEPFRDLTVLQTLKLNHNKIHNLNGALNNLQYLKHLYLKGNQLQSFDDKALKIVYHLETFDISENQLEGIKPTLFFRHWQHFKQNSFCKILLSENQITSIPNGTLKEISDRFTAFQREINYNNKFDVTTELDLSKNAISIIEYNAFQPLVRLVKIDLSCNKLDNFFVDPKHLEHVKFLNLSTNYIRNLYFDSFILMNNLFNLDLSHNNLDNIPDETFINNINLKYVNLTQNDFVKVKGLGIKMFHVEVGVLDLSENRISILNIPFGEGLRLTMLILHTNNITDVSTINLNHLNELENLDMSSNFINELNETSLQLPVTLNSLDLSNNNISLIGPATFHTVGHLRTLRLHHNKLTQIEYGTFHGLAALENLDLSFNFIKYLDSKVMLDLKSLRVLSLRYNGLDILEQSGWLGHKFDLTVYLDGNKFTCDWLGAALSDFNNGYSRMRPAAFQLSITGHSLEGISCIPKEIGEIKNAPIFGAAGVADERLLVIVQKILEAVKEQNYYMRLQTRLESELLSLAPKEATQT